MDAITTTAPALMNRRALLRAGAVVVGFSFNGLPAALAQQAPASPAAPAAPGLDLGEVDSFLMLRRDGSAVMVHKDSGIFQTTDLRGKRIAVPGRYANQRLIIYRELKKAGMTLDDVILLEMPPPDMPAALLSKAVDAITSGEPFMGQTELDGALHRAAVHHRQAAGQRQVHGAGLGVGLGAKGGGGAAENLARGRQLGVGLEADDDLVAVHQRARGAALLLCFKCVHGLAHGQNPAGLARW